MRCFCIKTNFLSNPQYPSKMKTIKQNLLPFAIKFPFSLLDVEFTYN